MGRYSLFERADRIVPHDELVATLYLWLLPTHIGLVCLSVTFFAARGLGVLADHGWPMAAWARRGSALVDTALLGAGGALWWVLQFNPLHDLWLGTKLLLLPVYIVMGSMALKRAPTLRMKAGFFVASLVCVAFMASIAVKHHPQGFLAS